MNTKEMYWNLTAAVSKQSSESPAVLEFAIHNATYATRRDCKELCKMLLLVSKDAQHRC